MNELFAGVDFSNPAAGSGCDGHVAATDAALALLQDIQDKHGAVSLHHEGGVCQWNRCDVPAFGRDARL